MDNAAPATAIAWKKSWRMYQSADGAFVIEKNYDGTWELRHYGEVVQTYATLKLAKRVAQGIQEGN